MDTSIKVRKLLAGAGLLLTGALMMSGCSNSNSGGDMSAQSYKQAAAGSPLTPSQHAAMMAAISQQQASMALEQAKDKTAVHVPAGAGN